MTQDLPDLAAAARAIQTFAGAQLSARIASLEGAFRDVGDTQVSELLRSADVSHQLLASAYAMKRVAGQINVTIHAIGILLCLPHILSSGEKVRYLSLGAGNTGKAFDLETNQRIAEFKFIHWRGGAEAIRQNALFKDFYLLAEHSTDRQKFLYVLNTEHPLKFLNSGRALSSVMSRNRKLWEGFQAKYGSRLRTVGEYYALMGGAVAIQDVSAFVPELGKLVVSVDEEES